MKIRFLIACLLMLVVSQQIVYAQQLLAQQAFAVFEQHCLNCHGEFGSYTDALIIKYGSLIEDRAVIPRQPEASDLYLRLLGDTDTGSQMPLGQEPLDSESIATIRRWIEAGAADWEAIPKPERRFITTEAMLQSIQRHVTSLAAFDRAFARYFTLTHLYNAGASDDNLRAYRNALSKLVNSLSWGSEVIKPKPIDKEKTIFYIDLRHYEWDIKKSNKWYKIEQAYPYGIQLKSPAYTTLCQETDCELPFVRADWFITTVSLPPLYHEILDLPKTDRELEKRLEVDVAENTKNAPGVRVWRAGFNESGVSVNNRIVERHKSRYGAYWKSYDFAGNIGTQNIFTHPLNFTHDGGEIIFNLPNGLQAYYLSTEKGERLDKAPTNIVSNAGARDPVVRNGLSCMGCHTEGMKTFEDQVRPVIEQNLNPSYDEAQALRLYTEKSKMDSLVREDIARYRQAIEAAGGVFGGSEPIQQLVKQFEGPLDATHAAAEVGLETDDFLKKIRRNNILQNAGLSVLGVENGSVKRDAWTSQFGVMVSTLNLGEYRKQSLPQIKTVPNKAIKRHPEIGTGTLQDAKIPSRTPFSFRTVTDAEWTILREDDIIRGDGIDGMLQDVYFMDNQNGLVVGDDGLMLKTSDGGTTWGKIDIDMRPPGARQRPGGPPGAGGGPPPGFGRGGPVPLYNIYFVDENVGYITGGRATILKTEDGGKTWARKTAMNDTPGRDGRPGHLRANLMGIQMISETTGFITGSENTLLKTTDGGETWMGSSKRVSVDGTRNNLENIWFVSPTTGWIIGSFGTLLHTTDGGETWEMHNLGFHHNLFGIHFLDENTGWICGQEGLILHTTDGGATWNQQKNESYDDLHDITFVDAMVGWAVGGFNSVLHTTDGGKTWTVSNIPGSANLKGVHATDANNCWTVNDWGVIAGYKAE